MINRFDECGGGYFSTTNGTITSPSYPGNYPDNADCIYTIAQPIGTVILLNFLSIDIQICTYSWCNPCIFDYLEIRDGPSADSFLLDKLCGSESPAPIQSNQNQLWMKWVEISLAKCLSEIKSIIWFISDSTPMAIRIERDFTLSTPRFRHNKIETMEICGCKLTVVKVRWPLPNKIHLINSILQFIIRHGNKHALVFFL